MTKQSPDSGTASSIHRQPMYIGSTIAPLFATLHTDSSALPRNCVTVICSPQGFEYTNGHRSIRHLADALARNGIPALRFDYHGTGDSIGSDLDPNRFSQWLNDIRVAIAEARKLCGDAPVCLLGVRIGALLAGRITTEIEVDWFVTWFSPASGRSYVREQQAASQALQSGQLAPGEPLETAGFLLTQEAQDALKSLDLLATPNKIRSGALLIHRDDLRQDKAFQDHLAAQSISVTSEVCSGFTDMVTQPAFTQVPQSAVDTTVRWLVEQCTPSTRAYSAAAGPSEMRYTYCDTSGHTSELCDIACRFGDKGYLLGIYTQVTATQCTLPTVVILNTGVVHRVGTNRLSILLSRNLAVLGFPIFRFDVEGVGDSVLRGSGHENHPYSSTAVDDVEVTLAFLRERFGARQFILMGLCSGAYLSFKTGVKILADSIVEIVLMNPLTFNWVEGDSVIDVSDFRQVDYYKESMRKGSSWKKLLRGQVNLIRLSKVVFSHLRTQLKSRSQYLLEHVYPKIGTVLANQLRSQLSINRHVALFIASEEPGWNILVAGARLAVKRGLKRGLLSVQFIADADHTFSREAARMRLITQLRAHLQKRYKTLSAA